MTMHNERRVVDLTATLLISTLGVMLLGFVILRRMDAFFDSGGFLAPPGGGAEGGVLVCGSPSTVDRLEKLGVRCAEWTGEGAMERRWAAVLALWDSDEENLSLCRAARRSGAEVYIVARCHAPAQLEAFRSAGADRVLLTGETLSVVLAQLQERGR